VTDSAGPDGPRIVTVFRSRLRPESGADYHETAQRMLELAQTMPGFVNFKIFEADDGERVSVITFNSREAQRAWRDHPRAMIFHVFRHISETQLHQAVRPIETVRDVLLWNTGSSQDFGAERAVRNGNWWMMPVVIANWLCMTASVFVFCAFLIVTPIRLVREGWTAETRVSAGIWCFYLAVGGLYATVHLEPRYLTPVVAGSIVVGVVNIVRVIEFYRRPGALEPLGEKSHKTAV